ncbi:LacI family DNA-binding transcriptional regulator, partial [Burkholderia contaminans]|nr:LacI family DNA-binding transcriptional regulator [Burkholderia contaminans]
MLNLDFFHFFFSLGNFFREWFVKGINDPSPLLFSNFDIIQPSTVTRVIQNKSTISDETKKRVRKAMKELNY